MRRIIIAGNWKMNLLIEQARELASAVAGAANDVSGVDVVLGPPFTSIHAVVEAVRGSKVAVAAQDVFWEDHGAYTGEVSPAMLKDAGVDYVIIGHSERRAMFGETDQGCAKKVKAVLEQGLKAILCLGETLEEREAGKTFDVLSKQLEGSLEGVDANGMGNVILAYEPVWAIGTGKTATPKQAQEAHAFIRGRLSERFGKGTAEAVRIQYGGSMKPENAESLLSMEDVDGGLVGGASLDAESFAGILRAAARVTATKG